MIRALLLAMAIPGLAFASEPRMPFDVGGAFDLLDQHGNARTQVDPDGRAQLLFFGYANCPGICATAMPMIADITFALADAGIAVRPVMITVDPERDQVGNMDGPLLQLHPEFVGLTGTEAALETAYKAFSVEKELAFVDPEFGPVYTHGSFVYLLDAAGEVLTLFPPILDPDHATGLVRKYLTH